ncbi:MAG: cytochrome c3 family protein [Deltaproteobacteria bacterium]|nr:cytochrome c3 family protein [Deltaproteobacteria bacterium]
MLGKIASHYFAGKSRLLHEKSLYERLAFSFILKRREKMGLKTGKLIGLAALIAMTAPLALPQKASCEVFELNSLANLFEGVSFDHDMHIEAVSDNCSVCHHHSAGTPPTDATCIPCHLKSAETDSAACNACHVNEPFSSASLEASASNPLLHHKVKPGLKAAYHQNCLGCHQETGGPVGCQDCHALTEKGEKYYNTGQFAPKPGKSSSHH